MSRRFEKSFTRQEAIPEAAIERAVALMRSGKLHRYNLDPDEIGEASHLEREFAASVGAAHCLACTSGGYALYLALRAAGLQRGDTVLTNAFTLAPVPGAIEHAGGRVGLVEIDANYCVDLDHLDRRLSETGARWFMISHMRGHLADMDRVVAICAAHGATLIEDCAHTMGASWAGRPSGSFGAVAAFSTQTYKHINSGEGGLLTTDDPAIIARATVLSGSYMLHQRHGTAPPPAAFDEIRYLTPNHSGRLDQLRAALIRAQLAALPQQVERWNARYRAAESALAAIEGVVLPQRPQAEHYVGSSIQFRLPGLDEAAIRAFIERCLARGVELKWFGDAVPNGFTSRYDSWRYTGEQPALPQTLEILATTLDMRIPLTFTEDDLRHIAAIIGEVLAAG